MKYLAAFAVLGSLAMAAPAAAQEVILTQPTVTYYAPSAPVTTYYAPAVATPVTTYYAPSVPVAASVPVTTFYAPAVTTYYAPAVAVAPAAVYYVPPRVARRWARWGW